MQGGGNGVLKNLCHTWSYLQSSFSDPLGIKWITSPPVPGSLSWLLICLMTELYFLQFPAQQRSPNDANAICGRAVVMAEATGHYGADYLPLWDMCSSCWKAPFPNTLTGVRITNFVFWMRFPTLFCFALMVSWELIWCISNSKCQCSQFQIKEVQHLPPFVIIWYRFFCSVTAKDVKHISK